MSTMCPRHPGVAAQYVCSRCQQPCCLNCCYSMPDGSICCAPCYSQPPSAAPAPGAAAAAVVATPSVSSYQAVPTSLPARGCPQHPALPPVATCKMCGKGSCVTCDFFFPPDLHLCPVCVTTAHSNLTPRRKKYLVTGFCTAALASIGLLAAIGTSVSGGEGAALIGFVLLVLFVMIPAAVGTGIAWAAFKPGGPNPISVWLATLWNAFLLGAVLVFFVAAILMS